MTRDFPRPGGVGGGEIGDGLFDDDIVPPKFGENKFGENLDEGKSVTCAGMPRRADTRLKSDRLTQTDAELNIPPARGTLPRLGFAYVLATITKRFSRESILEDPWSAPNAHVLLQGDVIRERA